jgi:serine/threonine protein kinase
MLAGNHPNLVNLIGKLINHPNENKGLILSLIPPHYSILGNTPSFESCTRDVYNHNTSFSLIDTITIAQGISSVAAQLHEKGILHGDLYAHNTLIGTNAHPLFGDFGAASFYNTNHPNAALLERIEVNAFGCLLEDLLTYKKEVTPHQKTIESLIQLKEDCMQETFAKRPSFTTICKRLNGISQEFTNNSE